MLRCEMAIKQNWPEAPAHILFDEIFASWSQRCAENAATCGQRPRSDHLHLGHIGRSQGCVLTAGNVGFMLGCTSAAWIC